MQRSYDQAPTLRAGLIALLITLTIGFLINDSGRRDPGRRRDPRRAAHRVGVRCRTCSTRPERPRRPAPHAGGDDHHPEHQPHPRHDAAAHAEREVLDGRRSCRAPGRARRRGSPGRPGAPGRRGRPAPGSDGRQGAPGQQVVPGQGVGRRERVGQRPGTNGDPERDGGDAASRRHLRTGAFTVAGVPGAKVSYRTSASHDERAADPQATRPAARPAPPPPTLQAARSQVSRPHSSSGRHGVASETAWRERSSWSKTCGPAQRCSAPRDDDGAGHQRAAPAAPAPPSGGPPPTRRRPRRRPRRRR